MEPVTKADLAALRSDKKVVEKNEFIADRVKEIYNYVKLQARDSDIKRCQWCCDGSSKLDEFPTTNDELVLQLQTLFPDCEISYTIPTPSMKYIGVASPGGETGATGPEIYVYDKPPHYVTVDWQ